MEYYFYDKSKYSEIYKNLKILEYFKFTPKTSKELKIAVDNYCENIE